MMQSTMQDFPLTVGMIFRHGRTVHRASEVVTFEGEASRHATFAEVARARRPARGRRCAGSASAPATASARSCGTPRSTWRRTSRSPVLGAVLHTLNLRLFPEQLAYIVNHAEDRVIIVDDNLVPLLARVAAELETVEALRRGRRRRRVGARRCGARRRRCSATTSCSRPATRPASSTPRSTNAPPPRCVTRAAPPATRRVSSTRTAPRSCTRWRRAPARWSPYTCNDRILPIVPMFHANAWGTPYAAWMAGADLLMPGRFLQAEPLARFVAEEPVTCACAVPTIWADLLRYAEDHDVDFSPAAARHVRRRGRAARADGALRGALRRPHPPGLGHDRDQPARRGGAPAARASSPARPKISTGARLTGRVIPGVELRIVDDDGAVLPWDGEAVGEIQVRGPWVTGVVLRRSRAGEVRRRLAAHRRHRQRHRRRLHQDHRPVEGRHQVGRRVDLVGRARRAS